MQLLIKNAILRHMKGLQDIAIDDGKIIEITDTSSKFANNSFDNVIDAEQSLVTETLTSPHIHLDKILIGKTIINESGMLWEAIEKTWEYKRNYTNQDIISRASFIVEKQIEYGTTKIRTHIDVDSIGGLVPLKAMLEVKKKYENIVDFQIAVFPQEGIIQDEGCEELMIKGLETGADILGGMPHNEMTHSDSEKHVGFLLDTAEQFKVPIDAHVDETDDPESRTLQCLAAEIIRRQFKYGVTAGHTNALASYSDYHATRVIELVKKANINMISNPPTNMVLQGRLDTGAQRVGITRIKELVQAGVNVAVGQDCIRDPYYPFGRGDMLDVALLTGHAAKMTLPQEIELLYDFVTVNGLKAMGLEHKYILKVGAMADLLILKGVDTVWEAIRTLPPERTVIRAGNIISESSYSVKQSF